MLWSYPPCRRALIAICLMLAPTNFSCGSSDKPSSTPAPVATAAADPSGSDSARQSVAIGDCTAANAVAASAISIKGYAFDPACVKIAVGGKITFTNVDLVDHTATTGKGAANFFDSGDIKNKGTFVASFAKAGTTGIYCTVHPTMQMNVLVN